jgi:hypothetical protein
MYRDVRFALPFVIQLWLFASPVFYSIDQLPARWQWVAALNPMAAPIDAFPRVGARSADRHRTPVAGRPLDAPAADGVGPHVPADRAIVSPTLCNPS